MKKINVSDLIRWWKYSYGLTIIKAEVYMKLLNETLVEYRNSRNNIERIEFISWQCKKLHWVARAKETIIVIINIRAINPSIINLIEINNLTKLVILINQKRMTSQIIILTRKWAISARMRKWRMKKIIIILNVINRNIIIEIVQRNLMKQGNCNQNNSIRFKKRRSFADISTTKQKRSIKIKNSILIKK